MALKNAKFLYNILTQGARIRSEIYSSSRLNSGSKGGRDPCKPKDPCTPKDPCPPKEKCEKKDPCEKTHPCKPKTTPPPKDSCQPQAASESKSPCVSKPASNESKSPCVSKPPPKESKSPCVSKSPPKESKSPCVSKPPPKESKSPCASKPPPKESKSPCVSKPPPKESKSPCLSKPPSKDPCKPKKAPEPKNPCAPKSPTKPGVICPPPCCPPPCCPAPPDEGGKPICSSAVDGKVAIITGGSVGIGYYCALAILKNGGKVMLGDVKVEEGKEAICKIIDKFGYNKAAFIKCDVTIPRDMECLFNAAQSEFNQIDIVVNNAGILMDKLWEKCIDINAKAVVKGTFLGFQHMRRNKNGGMIVNMASILGHQSFHGCPIYCGTKHFVVGFSRSMGHDYFFNQTGVKVMTMCPGVTVTSMTEDSEKHPQLEGFGNTAKVLHEELFKLPTQTGEACGNHLITILEGNINGSDWISEAGEVYRVKRVDRNTLRI